MAKTREDSQPLDTRTIPLDLDDTRVSARTGQRRVLASDTQGTTEPSPREVNRQIRDQMKAQRLLDATKSRGAGSGLEVLGRVQRKHPKNPKAQVAMFFHEFVIKAGTGRSRPVSDRTRSVYGDGIIRMIDDLRADRAAIQNLGELGKAHVLRLIQYWGRQGQSAATVQNKISILRRFLTFIGKPSIIPKGHELKQWLNHQGIEAQITRQSVATTSKAWSDMDIDFHDVLIRLREISAITAMQLEVQAAFGLRMKESLQLNPKAADYGNSLRIIHGTKGGLPRDIDFDPEPEVSTWQRDVLERAKVFAEKNRKGTLSIPGKSLEQSKAHFYYQIRKVGVTRDQLGVTAHGLRHQYAARRYNQITGFGAPVGKSAPLAITPDIKEADLQARMEITRQLGHFRADVPQAYLGSLNMLEKGRKERMQDWIQRTEENPEFQQCLKEAGITSAWLGGKFAQGLPVDQQEKLRLIVRPAGNRPLPEDDLFLLKQHLCGIYERGVDLSEHLRDSQPDEALEIMVR